MTIKTDQTVLILGAASDVAVALGRKFASEGFNIIAAGRNMEEMKLICTDLIERYQIAAFPVTFDALQFSDHAHFFTNLPAYPQITICVFGYLGDQAKAQLVWQESLKILETNFIGAVSILNQVAEDYEKARKGTIIGISSVAGDRGRSSNYYYGSAKAGLTAFLSGLRNRLFKFGVHVMTVKPGFIATQMTEKMNLPPLLTAHPEEVAKMIYNGYKNKKNVIYVKGIWFFIINAIKLIPESLFKKTSL